MNKKRQRRAGKTETFSVSVDAETKRALRAMADSDFEGNLSALVTSFAEEARRRLAAGRLLRRLGAPVPTADEARSLEKELAREVAEARRAAKRKKRRAA